MNSLLAQQLGDLVGIASRVQRLACEPQLRAAAGTLWRTASDEVSATTVVGTLGVDDVATFERLVEDVANEFELTPRIRLGKGSFAVRFTRRAPH
jgi:hypothetical protein